MNQISTGMRDWSIRPDTPRNASRRKTPNQLNPRRGKPSGSRHPMEIELKKAASRKFPTTRVIFSKRGGYTFLAGPGGAALITPTQLMLFVCLAKQQPDTIRTSEEISEEVWPDPDTMPDYWADLVRIQIHHLRQSLKKVGSQLSIITVWGRGYFLERSGAEVIS